MGISGSSDQCDILPEEGRHSHSSEDLPGVELLAGGIADAVRVHGVRGGGDAGGDLACE